MIPFDFVYYRPETLEEAFEAFGGRPEATVYYAGGTEIVTGCRVGTYKPEAVIDIKSLPECRGREKRGESLFFGAALSLNDVIDDGSFPLLASAARGVADRTARNRITLGGNAAGRLPYREVLLAFLAAGGIAHLAGPGEVGKTARRDLGVRELHAKRLVLKSGEILLGFSVPERSLSLPCYHERATRTGPVDYPIVALCAQRDGDKRAAAVSGAYDAPLWVQSESGPLGTAAFPKPRSDARSSSEYRSALFEGMLRRAEEALS